MRLAAVDHLVERGQGGECRGIDANMKDERAPRLTRARKSNGLAAQPRQAGRRDVGNHCAGLESFAAIEGKEPSGASFPQGCDPRPEVQSPAVPSHRAHELHRQPRGTAIYPLAAATIEVQRDGALHSAALRG